MIRTLPRAAILGTLLFLPSLYGCSRSKSLEGQESSISYAPDVPPPIDRSYAKRIRVEFYTNVHDIVLTSTQGSAIYPAWTFNGRVPGPFIRTRVHDTLDVSITNGDSTGLKHNVDFHAVLAPGGGAIATSVKPGEHREVLFPLEFPGLYVYHCAADPVWDHIANGMYGLILIEPEGGLPRVDREFYIMQGEFYTTPIVKTSKYVQYSPENGLREDPQFVLFNAGNSPMTGEHALKASVGDRIRIFFGDAGPNKVASFHIIGEVLEDVYIQGDLVDPPRHAIQTTLVPPGGSTVVEFTARQPGDFTFVDHAVFRLAKGATGVIRVTPKE